MPDLMLPTWLVTGYSATARRLQISLPIPLISHLVISIPLDPTRGTSLVICNRGQCEASCHLLITPDTNTSSKLGLCLGAMAQQMLCQLWYIKILHTPPATQVSIHIRQCPYASVSIYIRKCPYTSDRINQSASVRMLPYVWKWNSFSYIY
jgi:hypothetical protein